MIKKIKNYALDNNYDFIYDFLQFFTDISWEFKYRFVKKYQYNIVRTNLPPNYHEVDTRMEAALTTILFDFVEKELLHFVTEIYEKKLTSNNYEEIFDILCAEEPSEKIKEKYQEMKRLYCFFKKQQFPNFDEYDEPDSLYEDNLKSLIAIRCRMWT